MKATPFCSAHDAVIDVLVAQRRKTLWWRNAAFASTSGLLITVTIQHPEVVLLVVLLVALLCLFLGGILNESHRGNADFTLSDTAGRGETHNHPSIHE